ncbi:MAG: cell surface protein SprA [Bacteroidetes bacterium]|jgi:cell surface protein SprA|nr:cell surface protein SprA [Bacteroidota bacterium]
MKRNCHLSSLKKNIAQYFIVGVVGLLILVSTIFARPTASFIRPEVFNAFAPPPDTIPQPIYPIPKDDGSPNSQLESTSPLFLSDPPNIKREVVYDPVTRQYVFLNKIGDFTYRTPSVMNEKEYMDFQNKKGIRKYWEERAQRSTTSTSSSIIPAIYVGGKVFDQIFGSNTIDIRPQGSAEVTFGVRSMLREDPQLDVRQRRTTNFDFDQRIQMNVIAKIGEKIEFKVNYNTEATFQFENRLALKYEGKEDEIVKLIEAGNVSMPLNTTLIRGSQALFGLKTKLQFGRTSVTAVFSQQESETKNITVQGGAQSNKFKMTSLDYEENRHFFLSQYFRQNYETGLQSLPIITSDINITRVEVWVTNIGPALQNNRNIVAFTDLGEGRSEWINNKEVQPTFGPPLPSENSNNLISRLDTSSVRNINTASAYLTGDPYAVGRTGYFVAGQDFEKIENARKLSATEYTFNSKLGFISLNTNLGADQTLAVAYQYTVIGYDSTFQVGEFADHGINAPKSLVVKLLKGTSLNTRMPMWNLMMKNVYSIRAFQVNRDDFTLNILFSGNQNGIPTGYFTEGNENVKGIPLIHLMGLDNLNQQGNPVNGGDGVFDFLDNAATQGGTINAGNGRIFFTVLEPFGSHIRKNIFPDDPELANRYAYDSLYTLTKSGAEQYPEKNKFLLEGFYKSQSGSEISLNALNVPQGSVRVTAGGVPLTENLDYTVDYTLGRVRIINEGILSSGTPINISLESNSMFSIQQKRMMGLRVDHEFNRDFRIGATLLNLHERPLTQKVNYGDDPISNTIYGFDVSYRRESQWITKMIDKLPFYSTNQVSRINVDGEFAHFLPGHSRAIGSAGTSYIDDFEGAKSTIDLRQVSSWHLASTPQGQMDIFPEAAPGTGLLYGKNRAKLAWYIIDPLFYDRFGTLRPSNVDKDELSKHSVRQVLETEVFPNKEIPAGTPTNIAVLNLAYYPNERGPYNYDVRPTQFTSGMTADGTLANPSSRWGGIMRRIESTDFEATNIEYIEFWMMDPFADDANNSGELYINLGDISEDILRDGRRFFEHGLPVSEVVENVDTTIWGRVPTLQALVESFSNLPGSRRFQDVGYDGLRDEDERSFHAAFLQYIREEFGENSIAYTIAEADPSADNYQYFRGSRLDSDAQYSSVLERYKNFNGPDGNSPTDDLNPESYPTSATSMPNAEDINRDNTLSEAERYFQYRVKLDPNSMKIGENFIADIREATGIPLSNGSVGEVKWYQFRIPISQPEKVVGNIEDYRSIRFIRMFMRGFEKPVVARFATLELVRGEWRKYRQNLQAPGEYVVGDDGNSTKFEVSAVNVEENGRREPIPYVIPPGIEREINYGSTSYVRLNEQAMQISVTDLLDGDARAVFKTTEFDFRQYKKLKMFVHAEKLFESPDLNYGELTVFIRLGSDFNQNYYEYEIPLTFTPWYTAYTDAEGIWPEANSFDITLEDLVKVKLNRNTAMRNPNSDIQINFPYIEYNGDHQIKIIGNPNISDVKGIMIGIRNPKQQTLTSSDDGQPKSAIIWVNELRVSDFNSKGGWASSARIETVLADLGRVVLSGSHTSPGFGSLEMKVNETAREAATNFDIATDIDLGKFFPQDVGLRIPMHFDYGESHIKPEYNPLDPDVKQKDILRSFDTKNDQDSIKNLTNDFTMRKNLNFVNVRKERTSASPSAARIYDVENWNVSFSYSELFQKNIDVEYDRRLLYRGGLGYNYNSNPKNVQPFQRAKWASKPVMQLVKDFNFFYLPRNISFRTDMNRQDNEKKYRNKSEGDVITYPIFAKQWTWNRNYDLKFDLTRSITLDYSAGANAYVYEPAGNPDRGTDEWNMNRDTIWNSILNLGSKDRFNQVIKVNYNIPINKIPIFNFISATAGYQGMFTWLASPLSVQQRIGNSIENQNTKQLNGNIDFLRLYNKVGYFQKLNTPPRGTGRGGGPAPRPGAGVRPGAEQPQPKGGATSDTTDKKPSINYFKVVGEQVLKLAMSVKRGSINYTQSNGQYLPGFMPEPDLFGLNFAQQAPGLGFVFGSENDIRSIAVANNWLSRDTLLNQAFARKYTENLGYRINLEPVPGMRLDVNGDRTKALNFSEYFRADSSGAFQSFSPVEAGNFSISYALWNTSFVKAGKDEKSELFDKMLESRMAVAERLAYNNPDWVRDGERYVYDSVGGDFYPYGYGAISQEVVLYSFMSAYSGKEARSIALNPFPKFPMPNWTLSYNGLTVIPAVQKLFKTVNITHAYRSTYSVNSWRTNTDFDPNNLIKTYKNSNIFIGQIDLGQIVITEQFSPLLGIDVGLHNSMTARVEYKKQRNLTMSFINNQLTEVAGNEIIIGTGYRIRNLALIISSITGGAGTRSTNDLILKLDLGFRTDITTLRRVDEKNSQISAGQYKTNLYFTADYMISNRFNLQVFFKRDASDPFISSQFKNSNTFAGVTMRFNLAQ